MYDFLPDLTSNLKVFKYSPLDNSFFSADKLETSVFSKNEINLARFNLKHGFENMLFCQSANTGPICFVSKISCRPCVFSFTFVLSDCAYTYLLSVQSHVCPEISKQIEECRKVTVFLESIKASCPQSVIFTVNDCLSKHINQLFQLKRLIESDTDLSRQDLRINQLTKVVCEHAARLYKGKVIINVNALPVTALANPQTFAGILMYSLSRFVALTNDFNFDVDVFSCSPAQSTLCISTNTKDAEKSYLLKNDLEHIFNGFCQKTQFEFSGGKLKFYAHFDAAKPKTYKVGAPDDQELYNIEKYKQTLDSISYVFSVSD